MKKIDKQKQLILAQLLASSPKLQLSIGTGTNAKTFTRDQIIQHVELMDEVGKDYVNTQIEFLRALKSGEVYEAINKLKT